MRPVVRALAAWLVVGATFLVTVAPAGAVPPGSRDSTFSNDGLVAFTNRYQVAMAAMSDTGVATAIYRDSDYGTGENPTSGPFRIIRHGPAGELLTYANGSQPLWQFSPEGLSVPDTVDEVTSGKLLVAGAQLTTTIGRLGLARLNTNGSYDTSFSGDGRTVMKVFSPSYDVVSTYRTQELTGGKIALAVYGGNYTDTGFSTVEQALVRLNANGSLDTTFSGDGILPVSIEAYDAAFDASGASFVSFKSGTRAEVHRYTPAGTVDTTFSGDGITSVACGNLAGAFLTADSTGRALLACLRFPSPEMVDVVLYRFTTAGALDLTYGTVGKGVATMPLKADEAVVFEFDSSARWWMAGRDPVGPSGMVNLVRVAANGALDPAFSGDGRAVTTLPWTVSPFQIEIGPTRAFVAMQRSTATTAIMAIAA